MPIKTVFYVSQAKAYRALRDLAKFVPPARLKNERLEVVSTLVFDGKNYSQLLEGPTKAVDQVLAKMALDDRHSKMRVLLERCRAERSYIGLPLTYTYDERRRDLITGLIAGTQMSSVALQALVYEAPQDRPKNLPG